MAKVNFKRIEDSSQIDDIAIEDGAFIVTGDGKSYIDYGTNRIPTNGTLDDNMSDVSRNGVENKVIKEYVDTTIAIEIDDNKPVVLFESANGELGDLTLSDSKSNYEYIELFAKSNGGAPVSTKIMTNLSEFEISTIDDNASPNQQKLWLKWGKYTLGETAITPIYQAWTEMTTTPTTTFVSSNFAVFSIYKVLGYK